MSLLDDLSGIPDDSPAIPMEPQAEQPQQAASQPVPAPNPPLGTAATQVAPGTSPAAGKGPQAVAMPKIVPRGTMVTNQPSATPAVLDLSGSFEETLTKLISKDLDLAHHDRALAIALLQTHLDRAEILDGMQLSMPVAQVIADNTGAVLKSLELAMKAGERVHKTAELIVAAQKNADSAALAALKVKMEQENKDNGWGTEAPGGG